MLTKRGEEVHWRGHYALSTTRLNSHVRIGSCGHMKAMESVCVVAACTQFEGLTK